MRIYPYPIEPFRYCYVTLVGGNSIELKPGQIGLNSRALSENTDLIPYQDRVIISKLDGSRVQPLYSKRYFTVVPIDSNKPDAYSKSRLGQVVFPQGRNGFPDPVKTGDQVILNSVLSGKHRNRLLIAIDSILKNNSEESCIEYSGG